MTTPLVIDLTAPLRPPRRARRAAVAFLLSGAALVTGINLADAGEPQDCGCLPPRDETVSPSANMR
jgi:hypothetical protein